MDFEEKDLKGLYRSFVEENPPHRKGCPDVEEITRSFSAEMSENEKIHIIDHISSCGKCYKNFEIVRQILKESKNLADQFVGVSLSETEIRELKRKAQDRTYELEKKERVRKQAGFIKTFIRLFQNKSAIKYAAVVTGIFIIALAAFFVSKIPQNLQESEIRGEKQEGIRLISPKGDLRERPTRFQWEAVPGAKEYQVVLLDSELTRLWESEKTESQEIPFPPGIQIGLKKKIYYWKLVCYMEGGTKTQSELQEFRQLEYPK